MKSVLEFYLNGKKRVVRDADPTQTLLDYVRSTGLTGTKLGCSEGGCGACTVSMSSWTGEKEHHYAVNGCITPLIAADGKHVTTIEGIGNAAHPHAAQERIAKFHGSQCGFCTPGIVMSLYALLRETQGKPTEEQVAEAFDGNLCRCTGYKPIIDAAQSFVATNGGCCKEGGGGCCKNGVNPVANGGIDGVGFDNGPVDGCCKNSANGIIDAKADGIDGKCKNGTGDCCKNKAKSEERPRKKARISMADEGCCGGGFQGGCCKDTPSESVANTPNGLSLRPYPHAELIFPPALKKYHPELLKITAPNGVVWYRPTTIKEVTEVLSEHPSAKLVGGASEFQIEAKIKGDEHPVVVYMMDIPELATFEHIPGKGIKFGANIPLSTLEDRLHELVAELPVSKTQWYAAVLEQLRYFAGRQIRNVATPAGNIATASPISDLNPLLVAANALLYTTSPTLPELRMGDREKPFFVGYRRTRLPSDGILTHVWLPESRDGEVVRTFKQAKRKDDDISIVTACLQGIVTNGKITEISLAYGGVAPFTVLAKSGSEILNQPVDAVLELGLQALADEFALPFNVPGGSAVYRRSLILSFYYKFVQALMQEAGHSSADIAALKDVTRTTRPVGVRELHNPFEEDLIGKSLPHASAMKQVTGEAQYIDDLPPTAHELHAVQVMSTRPCARIVSVDTSDIMDMEGVEGWVDRSDVAGSNEWGGLAKLGPDLLFADGKVQYVGDCIGLVVAKSRDIAARAARLVKVEYADEGDAIISIEQAIAAESFFDFRSTIERGNFDVEWDGAAYKFEGTCRTGAQEHFYLETQGAIVYPLENDEMVVIGSTQNPNEVQLVVAAALGIPANRVVAKTKRMGGGFGGKETRSVHYAGIAAVAAAKFGRPVRVITTRAEDMLQSGQRHPFLTKWRVTLDKDYKFTGLDARLYANGGYSMDLTKGVADRAVLHVDNCYNFGPNIHIKCWPCRTNTASNTAFRGFGGPQGMFVAESIIHEVSDALGITPDDLRRRNYYPAKNGVTPYGQNLGDDFTVPVMAEKILKDTRYDEVRREVDAFNSKSKWIKRGLAHVPTKFGISFGVTWLNQAGALVHIYEDGSVLVAHGGTEMGQGLHTKMTMVAAAELGVPYENVYISETSTQTVPNASPTAASASSDLNGMAIKNACDKLNSRLAPYRAKLGSDATMAQLAHDAYFDRVSLSATGFYKTPDIGFMFGDPNPKPAFSYYTQGNCVALVEVNCLTGDWSCLRADIIMDIGRPINQAIDYGQIEGAFIQGMGLFTMEESLWHQNGGLLTRGPGNYKIPGFRDIPQHFNVCHLTDRPFAHLKSIRRSKGIGEPPLFLGSTVMFALRDAVKAARLSRGLSIPRGIEAPLTTERIRVAVGDDIIERSRVEEVGKPFSFRA